MNNPKIILLAGAALMVLGSLLPWATMTSVFGNVEVTATEGDGAITLVIGILIGLGALLMKSKPGKRGGIASSIFGVIAGIVAIIDMSNIQKISGNPFADVQVGIGLYLVAIGALVTVVGGFVRWPDEPVVEMVPGQVPPGVTHQ